MTEGLGGYSKLHPLPIEVLHSSQFSSFRPLSTLCSCWAEPGIEALLSDVPNGQHSNGAVGEEAERKRERGTSILLSQAEKAVIRWEEGCQLTYLQDNKIVSHVSGIETVGWEKVAAGRGASEEGDREGNFLARFDSGGGG